MHIIFYDDVCPLCNRAVNFVLARDKKKIFYFAPLTGESAKEKGLHLKRPDCTTLVLLQNSATKNPQYLVEGRAALRILWLLGGKYAWLGWLSFLPSALFDGIYRLIARYRYRLLSKPPPTRTTSDRFLK